VQSKFKVLIVTFTLTFYFALCTFTLAQSARRFTPYLDALPIFDAIREDLLPPDLRDRTPAEREALWSDWIRGHDAAIRARVQPSDSSIFIDFGVEQALDAMKIAGAPRAGSIRRVAIVGPGLDTSGKRNGDELYPEQTIQPFALIDTLLRLDLAEADRLELVAFDVSPRVLQHVEAARTRARAGTAYTVVAPRNADQPWTPDLAEYWERLGNWIGDTAPLMPAAPPSVGRFEVRAIAIRPPVVASVTPIDLNIVTERLAVDQAPFDLIVATNVLSAYGVFDQLLAAANLADMLRAGGFLLTNTAIVELPENPLISAGRTDVSYVHTAGTGPMGDRMTWYRRSTSR
jgi:hypothetical protein